MFKTIFFYRSKALLRSKETMFWSLLFPMLLGTLFYFTFTNILEGEGFETVPVGLVDAGTYENEEAFLGALESVSGMDEERTDEGSEDLLFNVTKAENEEEAEKLLSEGKISGYILLGDDIELVVNKSGYGATIIKSFLDYFKQKVSTVENLMEATAGKITPDQLEEALQTREYVKEIKVSEESPNIVVNYFYTLLAMSCMFASMAGVAEITGIQANQSPLAARLNIVPAPKLKVFLGSAAALAVIQTAIIALVFLFLALVLRVDFGKDYLLTMLTNIAGVITGISFGTAVGAVLRAGENLKTGICSALVMLGCYLAGMMDVQMKYRVQANMPVIAKINPVNRLTDAYYSLYYYDTNGRYWQNMAALGIMTLIFLTVTFLVIRRQQYESI